MKNYLLIAILLSITNCFSQSKNDSLINVIKSAEKILLTSHQDYYKQIMRKPVKGEKLYESKYFRDKLVPVDIHYEILSNNEPNDTIIQERIILDSVSKMELIKIISKQKPEEYWEGAFCFNPHHTIFLFINKKWEYIDVCFGCDNYNFSKGININRKAFLKSDKDWNELKEFFKKLNLTYKLFGL